MCLCERSEAISREGELPRILSPIVLLRYACNPLSPKEKARMFVILSASEISHDLSEEYILRRPSPSREFAHSALTGNSCPPSDFRCAFFKGAIRTDTIIFPFYQLFKGIATPAARNDTLFFVILSASEISHHLSEKVKFIRL